MTRSENYYVGEALTITEAARLVLTETVAHARPLVMHYHSFTVIVSPMDYVQDIVSRWQTRMMRELSKGT